MNANPGDLAHVRFISAGAGSGKTRRLTEELERFLTEGDVTPAGVLGTTFTVKAASELRGRVRKRLIEGGQPLVAEQMSQALVGTVHSVCGRLLTRFAFELGLSPELEVVGVEDASRLFNHALDEVLSARPDRVREMHDLAARLGLVDPRERTSWEVHVREIASEVRSNNIEPEALPAMGRDNADRFLDYFPEADCDDEATEVLLAEVEHALEGIDLAYDTTGVTQKYVNLLRTALAELKGDRCPLVRWISLSKNGPGKKSEGLAHPVQAAAHCYDRHAGFHRAIRSYIEGVFTIAGEAISRFQELKTERGLVNYDDLEHLALHALDHPSVVERLDEELELLLVDEFQDTNPMQLALFMKLARFAREVIFVGDVKQAIFSFRGADPDLVHRALEALEARGCQVERLGSSWRSRPALLRYLNAVFVDAFARDGMERARIELEPERPDVHEAPAVIRWTVPGTRNKQVQGDALAIAISDLVRSGHTVNDPESGEPRPVTFGDIAMLARTNDQVHRIATALRNARVPMKMTLAGLLETPEVCLARACLRRLNDPSDTLATAEIRALGSCEEPEVWLADRLRSIANGEDRRSWSEGDDPIISRIAGLRPGTVTQSPAETVSRVLNYVGIRPVAAAWGPDEVASEQRQRNLDAFFDLAVEYESHCASQHDAATLTGFLLWLENPTTPDLDLQPVVIGGNAVHVLTYHRAKGLEWPVVVATDFFDTWRPRIWDIRTGSNRDGLNLDNPLEDRSIRFYPNVFGPNRNGVPVLDAIMASPEGTAASAATEAECRRLAYVGMTRARDTVIVAVPPTRPSGTAWFRSFASDHLLPAGDEHPLPDVEPVPSACVDLSDANLEVPAPRAFNPEWFLERVPTEAPLRERVAPSQAEPVEGAVIGDVVDVGPRIAVHSEDMGRIGTALHAVIAAELVNPDRDDAVDSAASLIRNAAGDGAVAPEDAIGCARRFTAILNERFAPTRILVEHPVELAQDNGQVLHGWIDLLLETEAGWVIIDHKSSPRPRAEWTEDALEHSGQLAAYARALRGAGHECAGCWIHFPVGGGLLEVILDPDVR